MVSEEDSVWLDGMRNRNRLAMIERIVSERVKQGGLEDYPTPTFMGIQMSPEVKHILQNVVVGLIVYVVGSRIVKYIDRK